MLYIQGKKEKKRRRGKKKKEKKVLQLLVLIGVSCPLLQFAWSHGRMYPPAGAHSHHLHTVALESKREELRLVKQQQAPTGSRFSFVKPLPCQLFSVPEDPKKTSYQPPPLNVTRDGASYYVTHIALSLMMCMP